MSDIPDELAKCKREIEQLRTDFEIAQKAAGYWWVNWYVVQGKTPPLPNTSDEAWLQILKDIKT